MNRKISKVYLLIVLLVIALFSVPKMMSDTWRSNTIAWSAPLWELLAQVRFRFQTVFTTGEQTMDERDAVKRSQVESALLQSELVRLQGILQQERTVNRQLQALLQRRQQPGSREEERRYDERLLQLLSWSLQAVPAQVIYRTPATWSSSLWINVGRSANLLLGREVIAKNSPVVIGLSVVGVIDYVGEHQARVRLITDSGLSPSVRAMRGGMQQQQALESVLTLLEQDKLYTEVFSAPEEKQAFKSHLEGLKSFLQKQKISWLLAKGEVHGGSSPLWRSVESKLYGIGFNYDFEDASGPARDLRTGRVVGQMQGSAIPIIKAQDLLVTTGMDGVFPPGLHVGTVTKIQLLKEGDYYYELEARPSVGDLNELSLVFVLPPVGYDPKDQL